MKSVQYLNGDIRMADKEKKLIEETIKRDPQTVFVLTDGKLSLRSYITYLHDERKLKNSVIHRFRICKQVKFNNDVTFYDYNKNPFRPENMGELLKYLSPGKKEELVIENNSRKLLAEVMQQLVYIDYPITDLRIQLRKEYEDAEKTERFMLRIDDLDNAVNDAEKSLQRITIDEKEQNADELREILDQTNSLFSGIKSRVDKARDIEMKIAAVASKKTGKSVIVNSMIGKELAPTSLELATPNTCIYKKSHDESYHLLYGNTSTTFKSEEDLRKRIGKEFTKAESGQEKQRGHLLENMTIEYVSKGTNFESYTVYDTPGPDAAGTDHHKETEKAVNDCDVAIFAFDYSKYLTNDETDFLDKVKKVFDDKGKFHTLIFTVNKMDLALDDKGTKSRISFLDLIRTRLKEIDPKYGECVIFATSALDYFRTIELQDAAKQHVQCLPLLENDLVNNIQPVIDYFYDGDNEEMTGLLSQIQSEVIKIHNQLRFEKVTMKDLQYFSGMPQFLSYVSYIAKSKAREEIINNITGEINLQKAEIQAKIDLIKNIESLMEASDEKINEIKAVLDSYRSAVNNILSKQITESDKNAVRSSGEINALIREYKRKHNNYNPDIGELLGVMIEDGFPFHIKENLLDPVWSDVKKILRDNYRKEEKKNITDVSKLQISDKIIFECAEKQMQNFIDENAKKITDKTKGIAEALQLILKSRNDLLKDASNRCQKELEQFDVKILLPQFSGFVPSLSEPEVSINKVFGASTRSITINYDNKKISSIRHFFRWLTDKAEGENEVKVKHYSDDKLNAIFDSSYKQFEDLLTNSKYNLEKVMKSNINELIQSINKMNEQVEEEFNAMNTSCESCVDTFMLAIDERDQYLMEKERLKQKKELITQIKDATNSFMLIWSSILQGEEAQQ